MSLSSGRLSQRLMEEEVERFKNEFKKDMRRQMGPTTRVGRAQLCDMVRHYYHGCVYGMKRGMVPRKLQALLIHLSHITGPDWWPDDSWCWW